jgi:hypothetical protein
MLRPEADTNRDEFMGNLLVIGPHDRLTDSCAQPPFSSLLALTAA